jgi:hypothetical protein
VRKTRVRGIRQHEPHIRRGAWPPIAAATFGTVAA